MESRDKVSIIIPTYNRAGIVEDAIQSALDQTYKKIEVIVVDDGSTDETADIIEKYDGKVKHFSILHAGVSAARNVGIKRAEGEWLAFLDSDDYWLEKKLEKQMKYTLDKGYLISQTGEKWYRDGNWVMKRDKHKKYSGWIFSHCLSRCVVTPSAAVINKSVFENVGYFDESLPACEDYDMWLRIACKYRIGLLEEELVVKRGGHEDQLSKKYWGLDRFRVKALEKILEEDITEEQQKMVLKEIVKKLKILEKGRRKRSDLPNIYRPKLKSYINKLKEAYGLQKTENLRL